MSSLGRIGLWAGLAAFTATVAYDIVQILQVVGVLHFPLDEILIFGASLCISSSRSLAPMMLLVKAFTSSRRLR